MMLLFNYLQDQTNLNLLHFLFFKLFQVAFSIFGGYDSLSSCHCKAIFTTTCYLFATFQSCWFHSKDFKRDLSLQGATCNDLASLSNCKQSWLYSSLDNHLFEKLDYQLIFSLPDSHSLPSFALLYCPFLSQLLSFQDEYYLPPTFH